MQPRRQYGPQWYSRVHRALKGINSHGADPEAMANGNRGIRSLLEETSYSNTNKAGQSGGFKPGTTTAHPPISGGLPGTTSGQTLGPLSPSSHKEAAHQETFVSSERNGLRPNDHANSSENRNELSDSLLSEQLDQSNSTNSSFFNQLRGNDSNSTTASNIFINTNSNATNPSSTNSTQSELLLSFNETTTTTSTATTATTWNTGIFTQQRFFQMKSSWPG